MSSTQRVILTVVICSGLLIVWHHLFPPPKQTPKGKESQSRAAQVDPRPQRSASSAKNAAAGPLAATREGTHTVIEREDATVVFSDRGATLRHWRLKNPRYREYRGGRLKPVDLVQTPKGRGPWQLLASFPGSDVSLPQDARFDLIRKRGHSLHYRWRSKSVQIDKTFVVDKQRPIIWMTVGLTNLGSSAIAERLKLSLFSYQDPKRAKTGFANPYPRLATGLCRVNKEIFRRTEAAITGEQSGCTAAGCGMGEGPVSELGQVDWVASDDRYFLTAVVPRGRSGDLRCQVGRLEAGNLVESSIVFAERSLAAGATRERKFAVFVGAKELRLLDGVQGDNNEDVALSASIEFGDWLQFLCRPMLGLLSVFHRLLGNWGLAIILLTLVVKLLTLYPTHKSMRSMKMVQKLKPKIDGLREKYQHDKQRLNQEMMNLYKTHKVNPLGGCLPMLIQMPIWFALYRTLGNAVELYRSPFFGWIGDLTAPDPYFVLPIAMGVSMFAQQWITPQPMSGSQAKMMKYFMPAMFTVMMLWLPSGLTLYIFVNTVLTFAHQFYMNRNEPGLEQPSAAVADRVPKRAGSATEQPNLLRPATANGATSVPRPASASVRQVPKTTRSKKSRRRKRPKRG